jgi:hypothetical protein
MTADYGTFEFGATALPLTSSTTNSLLLDADPAIAFALDFFAWGIGHYVGARLLAQAALDGLNLPSAVGLKVSIEPSPFLYSDQFKFPILALYRKHETWDEHTAVWDKSTSHWVLSYVLPPLTPLQQDHLNPILRSVAEVVRRLAHQGYDPGYLSGASVWDVSNAGIQRARLIESGYGSYEPIDTNGLYYRALNATVEVLEREMPVTDAFEAFTGADAALDVKDPAQHTVVSDVVDLATGAAPTVTGVSPDHGTKAGSTSITIAGTGFVPGTTPTVLVGNLPATSVVVVDSTSITCATPAHDAFSTFAADIEVTNIDGQSGTLSAGYTFTSP